MDAVEKMVSQVRQKGEAQVAEFLAEEKAKIQVQREKELAELKANEAVTLSESIRSLEKEYQQESQRQVTLSRQETLNIKQDYLGRIFKEAKEMMNQLPKEEYQEFCFKSILQVPDLPQGDIILGEYAKNILDDQWLKKVNEHKKNPLVFSTETAKKQGGFLVDQEGIEYNFLFGSLVAEIKNTESFRLSEILFKES